ncbi:MAG TPA: sigma-70 family RNA polymerase sigma factor [Thermoanaerobaculia bacterium]|nr:sigma-70 family RNA polymerase sigma factor [Thermoanaerobaculia bacterium]
MDPIREARPAARPSGESELMRRLAARDESALGELYDRWAPTLHALALRVLGDEAEAEEVLQEVFVHAWNHAGRYQPERSSVSTWLVLLARSRAIDRLRSRRSGERTVAASSLETPRHESAAGLSRVQDEERRRRVQAEMARLPPEQRRVLALAYYRGLSQSQIADSEGLPLGTVKTRTLLALRKLRQALGAEARELL